MANYNTLKAAVADVIKTNGNKEITGLLLQQTLLAIIDSLGSQYQFAGKAVEGTIPGTVDTKVAYLAGPGTYVNFGGAVIPEQHIGILYGSGSTWNVSTIKVSPIAVQTVVDDIIQLYDGSTPVYPRTKAEAVFFDNDTAKTLDQQFSQLGQEVDALEDISENTFSSSERNLCDTQNAQLDTRATGSYGADINSTYSSSGWTAFPPVYFSADGSHTLKIKSTSGQLLGYKLSGGNYVREASVNIGTLTPTEGVVEYTFGANIKAFRFEEPTANIPEGIFIHSTLEPKIYTLLPSVENPKLNQEVARLDARIDDITPGDVPWAGKKICGIGDSIMIGCYDSGPNKGSAILDGEEGSSYGMEFNSTGGFLGALRAKYPSIDILNMGVGSTTMARNNNITPNANYLCITDRIDNIPQNGYDYILLMGGANDFFHKDTYSVAYGTESNVEYLPLVADYNAETGQYSSFYTRLYPYSGSGNQDLDITTFCGAMEIALIKLMVRFKDRKLGYIIPHSIRPTTEMNTYFDYAKTLCKKYGIPCLDLRECAMMPRIFSIAGNNSGSQYTFDAVHPNTLGYADRYLPAFEAWLRTL